MQIDPRHHGVQPQKQDIAQREAFLTGFQASLEAARGQQRDGIADLPIPTESPVAGKTPYEELTEWLRKSLAEHMRDAILTEIGLTEGDVQAMSPQQRAALEETIAEKMKARLQATSENKQGVSEARLAALLMSPLIRSEARTESACPLCLSAPAR